ncbi:hypothetical protein CROQUDRAFT_717196, partial [Cronartium quercuum f. sp. fusiforme G11]
MMESFFKVGSRYKLRIGRQKSREKRFNVKPTENAHELEFYQTIAFNDGVSPGQSSPGKGSVCWSDDAIHVPELQSNSAKAIPSDWQSSLGPSRSVLRGVMTEQKTDAKILVTNFRSP